MLVISTKEILFSGHIFILHIFNVIVLYTIYTITVNFHHVVEKNAETLPNTHQYSVLYIVVYAEEVLLLNRAPVCSDF